jgi:hypothetical protein
MYKFGIQNFKSFAKLNTIRVAPITLIYGQNSAGKSSITQALRLLLQSFRSNQPDFKLLLNGELLELGLPETFFHKGKLEKPIVYYFEGPLNKAPSDDSLPSTLREEMKRYSRLGIYLSYVYLKKTDQIYSVQLDRVDYIFIAEGGALTGRFALKRVAAKDPGFELEGNASIKNLASYLWIRRRFFEEQKSARKDAGENRRSVNKEFTKSDVIKFLGAAKFGQRFIGANIPINVNSPLPELVLDGQSRDEIHWFIFSQLSSLNRPIHRILTNFLHIAGLRNSPQRHYGFGADSEFVGRSGEHTAAVLYRRTGSMTKMNRWFKLLELPYRIDVEPINHPLAGEMIIIKLKDVRNGAVVTPSDVGVGISQVLPLLTQGMADQEPRSKKKIENILRVRCVEQPELHLHPKLQANLADFFIESTRTSGNLRWLLETHSESLMLRLQRRIKEGAIEANNISVNYVNSSTGGGSKISELRLDSAGQFMDEWPEGFFEEGFNERFGG